MPDASPDREHAREHALLPKRGHLLLPPVLPGGDVTERHREYFRAIGVRRGKQSTYAGIFHPVGRSFGYCLSPGTLAALVRLVGWDTRHTVYDAFTEGRARSVHRETQHERSAMLSWLSKFKPKFTFVEVRASPRRRLVLKGALGLPCALTPVCVRRSEQGAEQSGDLVRDLWTELGRALLPLPLITTSLDPLTLETLLEASTRMTFDCFAEVDLFYQAGQSSKVDIAWGQPGSVDHGLGFSDSLQSSGRPVRSGPARFNIINVNERARYFAYGPSRAGRYYLQRIQNDYREAWRLLECRIRALDSARISLDDWPIEQFSMAPKARKAYFRMGHAVVMAGGFSLFGNMAAARHPWPNEWTAIYDTWENGCDARVCDINQSSEDKP